VGDSRLRRRQSSAWLQGRIQAVCGYSQLTESVCAFFVALNSFDY